MIILDCYARIFKIFIFRPKMAADFGPKSRNFGGLKEAVGLRAKLDNFCYFFDQTIYVSRFQGPKGKIIK